ncbi:MAG: ATP-binding cassette domain-containing protein [Lachnospiraceae bacterium]|nr:ATP-binding cassette domain-containing protein [Lachnospiraceae bacterium]
MGVKEKVQTENPVQRFVARNARYLTLLAIVALLFVIFGTNNPAFLKVSNLMNIFRQIGVLTIVSVGMTFIILTGGIDLSVGSNVAVSGMVGAKVLTVTGSLFLSFAVTLACASLFGLINGIMIGKFHIMAFIVTLAMMSVGRGLTMLIGNAASIKITNPLYMFIGQGMIMRIPVVVFGLVVLYMLFIYLNEKSVFCRWLYAIGGNRTAADANGIHSERVLIATYTLGGLITGIGAIFTVGRMGSAQPYAGDGLEFEVITAVVLGGTSLSGGIGKLKGTICGAILVGVLGNGLSMMQADQYFNYITKGILILAAVIADLIITYYRNQKMTPKLKEAGQAAVENDQWKQVLDQPDKVIEMKGITKAFPGIKVLDGVDVTFSQGQIHALAGENGAGKSTLMKILTGEVKMDLGQISINGVPVLIHSPAKAEEIGISIIHQELALVPELTVAQNIFLGKEVKAKIPGFISKHEMNRRAQELIDQLELNIDARSIVGKLTVSEQQMIEIIKAVEKNSWMIIMDEPTSSLTEREKEKLFGIIDKLKKKKVGIIYITHRMQEIFSISNCITILRDGTMVGHYPTEEMDENKVISRMVGRELNNIFDRKPVPHGQVVLEVEGLTRKGVFHDISFQVRAGEVLGLSGLMGAGRTEIARCIFGLDRYDSGVVRVLGKQVAIRNVSDAVDAGIAYVPEDRKRDGFIPFMSIRENIALPSYEERLSRHGIVQDEAEKALSKEYVSALGIKTPTDEKNVVELSGGNQQKVILSKWLAKKPKLLILDEPTRGVDVGAKAEIHGIIGQIVREGVAVIMISSEMPELLGSADRILVLREGAVTGEFDREEATQEALMQHSALA